MKSRDILFALNDIDDTLITDALEAPAKKIAFRKLLPIAACFALLCVLLLALLLFAGKDHPPTPPGRRIAPRNDGKYFPFSTFLFRFSI